MRNSTRRSFAVHQFPEHRSSPSCLLIPRLRGRRERERERHLLSPSFLTALSYSSTRSSPRFFPLPRFLPFPPESKGCAALRGYCLPSYGRERRLRYLFNANWKMLRLSLCLSFFLLKSGGGGARLTKLTESGASFCTYMLRICRKEPLSRPVSVFVSLRFLAFLASRGVKSSHVSSTFTCLVERPVISAGHFRRLKLFERTIGPTWYRDVIVFHLERYHFPRVRELEIFVETCSRLYVSFIHFSLRGRKNQQKFARGAEIRGEIKSLLFDLVANEAS